MKIVFLLIEMEYSFSSLDDVVDKLEQINEFYMENRNVAILWDVENVNPGVDSLFLDGFLEFSQQFGRTIIAQAFADWSNNSVKKLGVLLSSRHFELIHIPKSRKNSADMALVTHGIEIALSKSNINTFILVTGDSDFRSLIFSLRKSGKRVHIVCDVNHSSEDLLILADSFIDYRKLRPGGEPLKSEDIAQSTIKQQSKIEKKGINSGQISEKERVKELDEQLKDAFGLLVEAVQLMIDGNIETNLGMVKIRLKMLNPNFDEKNFGFKSWSNFIETAVANGFIQIKEVSGKNLLEPVKGSKSKSPQNLTKAFNILLKILVSLDQNKESKYYEMGYIAKKLQDTKDFPSLQKIGLLRYKEFFHAAEVRNLIEIKPKGMSYHIKRK